MKNLIIVLFFYLIFISSCNSIKTNLTSIFQNVHEVELINVASELNDILQEPSDFYVTDGKFFFIEPKCDKLLSYYDLKINDYQTFINKGLGPNDMVDIQNLGKGKNNNEIYAFDVLSKKIFLLEYKNDFNITLDTLFNTIKDSLEIGCICYDDSITIYHLGNDTNHFCLLKNNEKHFFGNFNFNKAEDVNSIALSNSVVGFSRNSIKNNKLVWASMFGDILEIFDYSNINDIKLIKSIVLSLPNIDLSGVIFSNSTFGVMSLTNSDNYIFALYSGKELSIFKQFVSSEQEAYKMKYADNILIFDWNGNPIKNLHLNNELCAISFDEEQNKLYGLGLNNDGNISMFQIKDDILNF